MALIPKIRTEHMGRALKSWLNDWEQSVPKHSAGIGMVGRVRQLTFPLPPLSTPLPLPGWQWKKLCHSQGWGFEASTLASGKATAATHSSQLGALGGGRRGFVGYPEGGGLQAPDLMSGKAIVTNKKLSAGSSWRQWCIRDGKGWDF